VKIEPNKYYKTRDGQKAKVYATDCGGSYPVHGAIQQIENDVWWQTVWTLDGLLCPPKCNYIDLVAEWREPIKIERWAIVHDSGSVYEYCSSEEEAINMLNESFTEDLANKHRIIKLTGVEETK